MPITNYLQHVMIVKRLKRTEFSRSRRQANKYSKTFFSKKLRWKVPSVNEQFNGMCNPYDEIENICCNVSAIHKGGTFYINNEFPMLKIDKYIKYETLIKTNTHFSRKSKRYSIRDYN